MHFAFIVLFIYILVQIMCVCWALFIRSQVPETTLPSSYPGRANFSLKSLKDSSDRLYDPPQVVSGATKLGWAIASCLVSADRVAWAGGTTSPHINTLARFPGTSHSVPSVAYFRTFRF